MGSLTRERDQEIVIVMTGLLRAGHMVDKDHDAARAAAKDSPEPTEQQPLDIAHLNNGGETRGER